jgi:uncharacterized protein
MTKLERNFGPWVVRYRWVILALALAVVAFCAAGLPRLTINNNTRAFFGPHNPQYLALKAFEKTYRNEQNVLWVIAPKDGQVFTRSTLAAVAELTEASWQIPYSHRVTSITNSPHAQARGDDLVVSNLVPDVNGLSDAEIARIREIALSDSILVGFLVSGSGHCTAIQVHLQLHGQSRQEVTDVAQAARRLQEAFRKAHPEINLYMTGGAIIDDAFADAARKDLMNLAPLMLAVLAILVGLTLRSVWPTVVIVIVIMASLVTGLGLAGWLGIPINAASVAAPTLILTLSVADSVHLLVTMIGSMRQGCARHQAIAEALKANLKPVFLTNITTLVGFSGVNFSESPPFGDLSNIINLGVSAAFLYAVLLLPALTAVLPIRVTPGSGTGPIQITRRLTEFAIRRYKPVLVMILIVVAVAGAGIAWIELDDNYLTYLDRSYEFRQATDYMIQNLSGWDIIEYSLKADRSGGITDPNYLETVDRFAQWYRQQPKVRYVISLADIMKRLNKTLHGDDPHFYRIPEQADLAAQYLLLYEMSLPYGQDLNTQIDVDRSATCMTVLFESLRSSEVRQMDRQAQAWLAAHVPATMQTQGTSLSVVWAHITLRNVRSMLWGSLVSLVLVSACMIVGLRSFKLAMVSLIPNLIPPFVAFGIWGFFKHQVGLGLSVVVAMTIGIVVDDTIHYLSKYQDARRDGADTTSAIRHAFFEVGTAMWVATLSLVAGFLVLTLSHYRISEEMGLICAMTFGIGCWMDYLMLPGLVLTFDRQPAKLPPSTTPSGTEGSTHDTTKD